MSVSIHEQQTHIYQISVEKFRCVSSFIFHSFFFSNLCTYYAYEDLSSHVNDVKYKYEGYNILRSIIVHMKNTFKHLYSIRLVDGLIIYVYELFECCYKNVFVKWKFLLTLKFSTVTPIICLIETQLAHMS